MFSSTRIWQGRWAIAAAVTSLCLVGIVNGQFPGFGPPRMPGMPRGPMGPIGPRGPIGPTGPFGPGSEEVHYFYCANCDGYVGEGKSANDKHQFAKCPHCGVTFSNTFAGMKQGARRPNADPKDPVVTPPIGGWDNRTTSPSPPNGFIPPNNPENGNTAGFQPPAAPPATPSFTPPATSSTTAPSAIPSAPTRSRVSLVVIVLLVGAMVLLVLAALAGGVIWMLCTAPSVSAPQAAKTKRRRNPNEYEPI
jgi:hypothetical protein